MTQNILVDSPSLFTGNTLVTAIPVDFLLHQPNSSTNLKCRIRITTSGSSCSSGVLFLFVGFFWLVGWLVGWVFVCLFVCSGGRRYFTSPFEWKGTYQYNNVCHFFQARNYQTPYQNSQVESPSRLTLTSSI